LKADCGAFQPASVVELLHGCFNKCVAQYVERHTSVQTATFLGERNAETTQEDLEAAFAEKLWKRLHFVRTGPGKKADILNKNALLIKNTAWLQSAIADAYVVATPADDDGTATTYALRNLELSKTSGVRTNKSTGAQVHIEKLTVKCLLCKRSTTLGKELTSDAIVPDLSNFLNQHIWGIMNGEDHTIHAPHCDALWKKLKLEAKEQWAALDADFKKSVLPLPEP